MHLPASANKAPPERTDFPRPGENVTAGDKRGNLARERLRGRLPLRKEFGKKMSKSVDNCPGVWYYT
jgi:hypothetical protein